MMLHSRLILLFFVFLLLQGCKTDNSVISSDSSTIPGVTKTANGETLIDVNLDGSTDYKIVLKQLQSYDIPVSTKINSFEIVPSDDNNILFSKNNGCVPFDEGKLIPYNLNSDSLDWFNASATLISKRWTIDDGWQDQWYGNWAGVENKYLPIQIVNDTNINCGWIKLSVTISGKITIHDFYLNQNAKESIKAGFKN